MGDFFCYFFLKSYLFISLYKFFLNKVILSYRFKFLFFYFCFHHEGMRFRQQNIFDLIKISNQICRL